MASLHMTMSCGVLCDGVARDDARVTVNTGFLQTPPSVAKTLVIVLSQGVHNGAYKIGDHQEDDEAGDQAKDVVTHLKRKSRDDTKLHQIPGQKTSVNNLTHTPVAQQSHHRGDVGGGRQ